MTLSPTLLDQEVELNDGEVLIGIRTGFGGLPVLEKGTPGILRGSKVLDDGQLEVTTDNVRVVISEPDKLILIAESCDGTTNPSSFAVL